MPPASTISVLVFGQVVTQGRERERGEVVGWTAFRREALVVWRYRRRARGETWGWGRERSQRFPRATRPGLARWNGMQQAGVF
jgi:hypothetical protein